MNNVLVLSVQSLHRLPIPKLLCLFVVLEKKDQKMIPMVGAILENTMKQRSWHYCLSHVSVSSILRDANVSQVKALPQHMWTCRNCFFKKQEGHRFHSRMQVFSVDSACSPRVCMASLQFSPNSPVACTSEWLATLNWLQVLVWMVVCLFVTSRPVCPVCYITFTPRQLKLLHFPPLFYLKCRVIIVTEWMGGKLKRQTLQILSKVSQKNPDMSVINDCGGSRSSRSSLPPIELIL